MNKYISSLIGVIIFYISILTIATRIINKANCREYSADLQEQGYSKLWADHKSAVEYGYIEPDELYQAIQED